MRSNWSPAVLILSLTINAAILGTLGYHYFINPPKSITTPCFAPGDSHLYQSLGLSEVQLQAMEPLAERFHRRMTGMKASLEEKRGRLIDLLQGGADPDKTDALQREMASTQDEIQREVIAHIADIKRILNPGQQEQFFDLVRQSMNCTRASLSPLTGGNR
jgi:Spy/CpxP family protein refolding chaperone